MGIKERLRSTSLMFVASILTLVFMAPGFVAAQESESGINLQITPSPIIEVIKPGVKQTIEFEIRNAGAEKEDLSVYLRKFSISNETGEVNLSQDEPSDVKDWITVASPNFSVDPGAIFKEKLEVDTPEDSGFSYSFAIMISRQNEKPADQGETSLKGAVAVFTLLTVDRPGAIRKFDIVEFSSARRVYEYLPAELTVKLKNTGNTITQPYGNIYIQRSPDSNEPISVLKLNENGAYLLPDVTRSFVTKWSDGFPAYVEVKSADNQSPKMQLEWNWGDGQTFRIGRYYAKVVAVYNDGERDVPIETTVSFWIIPWKLLLGLFVVLAILIVGVVTIVKKPIKSIQKKKKSPKKEKKEDVKKESEDDES